MTAPDWLTELQRGFAQSIQTPLVINGTSYEYDLENYEPKTVKAMLPHGDLSGIERLTTYNQQYWFRLLSLVQKEYPLLRHILGITEFNRLASRALYQFPSQHPELHHLPQNILLFLEQDSPWSSPQTREAARVDYAYFRAFFAEKMHDLSASSLTPETASALLHQPIQFQPSWQLIHQRFNCVETRLESSTHTEDEEGSALLEQSTSWVIYRGYKGVTEEYLEPVQSQILALLQSGKSLVTACEELQNQLDEQDLARLEESIQSWFQGWAELGWFTQIVPEASL
jgi:hypothetical protein